MSEEIIYLIEVAAYAGSTEETFRFCTGIGFTSLPTDSPANTFYEPRVEHPGLFRQDMFSPGATSGGSSGGYGEITLINTDGGLDSFIDYGFDGRRCVVKQGYQSQSLAEFATVITGTVEQCETSWNRVTLRLKDRSVELDVTLQDAFYAGDNALPAGIEGTAELKDKPKPLLYGKCNNVTPVMVNTSKLIYQISSNALYSIPAVYDNGVALALAAGYTNQADMEANAPAAGEYRVWLAGGCFRLGSSAAGTITADAVQGSTAASRTAGQIIKQIVTAKLGSNQIVEQSIITLDVQAPYVVGYYTGHDNVTATTALDTICASVGAWWGFDNSGLFWSKQLTPPDAAQSLMTLTEAEILSLDRTATADSDKGVPVYKINLDFSKNWTVQASGLAGSIASSQLLFDDDESQQLSTDRRNLLGMEYVRTSVTDTTVQTKHLLAPEITVQTTIDTLTDANTEAARLLELRKVRRDRLNIAVSMGVTSPYPVKKWDSQPIPDLVTSRYGHTSEIYGNYLYLIGGANSSSVIRLNTVDPTSAWEDSAVTDLPEARYYHSSCIYNGYLYVVGGYILNYVKRLNLANPSGAWETCKELPSTRYYHTCHIHNGYMYVVGGKTSSGTSASVIRLDMSDPINNSWDDAGVSDMSIQTARHSSCMVGNHLYVSGGQDPSNQALRSVIYIDLSNPTGSWVSSNQLPVTMYAHKMAVHDAYLFATGGFQSGSKSAVTYAVPSTNPNQVWVTGLVRELPVANNDFGLAVDGSLLFVTSGQSNTYQLSTGEVFGPKSTYQYLITYINMTGPLTSLGRTVTVKYPRYGYDAGRPMVIIGAESDHQSRLINLELWG